MTIIAPSIVTYEYLVSNFNNSFINVSFPYKVAIKGIWFTADNRMLNGTAPTGTVFGESGRILRLTAQKAKSPRTIVSAIDPPSDWAPFFGYDEPENQTDWVYGNSAFKPTVWLGIPENAPAGIYKDASTQYVSNYYSNQQAFRSSTGYAPGLNDANNPYWGNNGWNSGEFAANKYKTEMGIMNPDEVLNMFVWQDGGDWTDYDNSATVTIHVAYTGVSPSTEKADPQAPWDAWWYD